MLLDESIWRGRIYADGWRETTERTRVIEPATGDTLGEIGVAGGEDIDRAVVTAAKAQIGWAALPPAARSAVLIAAARLLETHRAELVEWIVRETGAIRPKGDFEVTLSIAELMAASALLGQPIGAVLPANEPGRLSLSRRVPFGVAGVIAPWNFPLILAVRSLAPALATGNAVVLKPDPQTPVSGGVALVRIFEEAGLPPGVLQLVTGAVAQGEALVAHDDVPLICFTGSSAAGRKVAAAGGARLKRVILELGGNNAIVVLDDADLDRAASAGAWSAFLHQGQICMAASRHLVHRSVAREYEERLAARAAALPVGDPFRSEAALGPMISARQVERADAIVRDSIAAGARVAVGATHDGLFYQPTVLAEVTPVMRAFQEEIFGPVAPITVFDSDDEAVALANATDYGLTASVQTASFGRGYGIAERLRTGSVHVNGSTIDDSPDVPFGGMGASGNGGRYGGPVNWDEFTQWRWMTFDRVQAMMPF